MIKGSVAYIIFLFSFPVFSQSSDTLTLQACYDSLYSNYPIARQKELQEKIRELKIKNVKSNYLPSLNFGAQSTMQSDVPHVQINTESPSTMNLINNLNIPIPPLWQNKIYVEINQVIYDGGMINAQKNIENFNIDIQQKSLEVELFNIREKINALYYNLIYMNENERVLNVLKNDLDNKCRQTTVAVNSGAMLERNLDMIEAEKLKLEQQIAEIQTQRKNLCLSLKEIVRRDVTENTILLLPDYDITNSAMDGIRPEIEFMNLQKQGLDKNILLLKATRRPKFVFFGQGGYGRPGLNMLSNKFDPYGIFGVKFNYTLFDWQQKSRNIEILEYQKNIISTRLEAYELNQRIAMHSELNNIDKMQSILQKDDRIIELRSNVSRISSSKFESGNLTSREYLTEKYNEAQAEISRNLHKIQLLNAKLNYLTISGKMK
jgi:outer membrane protein TolC